MSESKKKAMLGAVVLSLLAGFLGLVKVSELSAYVLGAGLTNTDTAGHAIYQWVYNSDNVAHENGDVVVWYDGTLADGLEVSTTTTANNSLVAGIVAPSDIAATTWGFIQVAGYHSAITTTGTVAAGDLITTSTTGESGRAYTVADATGTVAGQGDDWGVFAVALTADSSNTNKGFIIGR